MLRGVRSSRRTRVDVSRSLWSAYHPATLKREYVFHGDILRRDSHVYIYIYISAHTLHARCMASGGTGLLLAYQFSVLAAAWNSYRM